MHYIFTLYLYMKLEHFYMLKLGLYVDRLILMDD